LFQVRATIASLLGDIEVYPCHFGHRPGDQVLFDGEAFHGRFCPDLWGAVMPKMIALHQAGPRYVEWASYCPFWYRGNSAADPGRAKHDGLGFRNILETITPPGHDMATLAPPGAFTWPPSETASIARQAAVVCPDTRTSMVVRLEAFDLSEKGYATPYFRRQMAILEKVRKNGGVAVDGILGVFTQAEREEIYPPLGTVMVELLIEELEYMGDVERAAGLAVIAGKGEAKLDAFKAALPREHLEAWSY
jgi:uncharacterized repeat protein (TIGR04076 family)